MVTIEESAMMLPREVIASVDACSLNHGFLYITVDIHDLLQVLLQYLVRYDLIVWLELLILQSRSLVHADGGDV